MEHAPMRALLLVIFLTTCAAMAETPQDRRKKIEAHEQKPASKEALERKQRSIARLKAEGVRVNDSLPVIADSKAAKARSSEEVARRAVAVCLTAVKGEGLEQKTIDELVKRFQAETFFSPKELAFIQNADPARQERVQFSWRYECYWVLLWALGYVETLEPPHGICDVKKAIAILRDRGTEKFIKEAKLRPLAEILDEADLIYRYHWAVVDARVNGGEPPSKVEGGVVMERHYVLNWLVGYMDQPWDDVSTDT
jgi:hypothetical protein